jgi:uncharacterized membrane protein
MSFPSIPGWDGIHPLMVQFAIVLLLVAPIFLLVSLFARKSWRTWSGAALLVMALGTLAAWLAVGSGHAAGQLVDKTTAVAPALAGHEAMGILTRNLFTWLTLAMAALVLLPVMIRKTLPDAARIGGFAMFMVLYLGSTLMVANTAQQGGRLVHELGIRAMLASAEPAEAPGAGGSAVRRDEQPSATTPPQAPPKPAPMP